MSDPSSSSSAPPQPEEAIPLPKPKPAFVLPPPGETTNLLSRLQSFLPQLRDANEQLEEERKNGTLHKRWIEVKAASSDEDDDDNNEDSEDSSDDDSSDEDDEDEDESESKEGGKGRKQYIEMNLGLGVLEERPRDAEGNVRMEDIRTREDSDVEMDDGTTTVLDRLKGQKGKGTRPNIEVVDERS